MYAYLDNGAYGLADLTPGQVGSIGGAAVSIGTTAGSTAPTSTKIEAGVASSLATAAAFTPPPANLILAGAAVIAEALAAFGVGSGCGQTCIKATQIVNNAEPSFLANVQQYENGEISQDQAIATYNNLWTALQVACAAIPGDAGKNCIGDRQQGSCKWRQTSSSPLLSYPGEPQEGECWDWYLGYYAPLTYPALKPMSPTSSASALASGALDTSAPVVSAVFSGSFGPIALIGLAVVGLWLVLK